MTPVDRTHDSPEAYRVRERRPREVDLIVLHQTGTPRPADLAAPGLDRVKAHALVLDSGEVRQLHPWLARLRYGSGAWNSRCISVEHRANLPGRYHRGEPRWWRPDLVPPEAWSADERRAQVLASRDLLRLLVAELPAVRFIAPHRMVQAGKGGCCGPDLWREVGEWAIRELGLVLPQPHEGGSALPPTWRGTPEIG